MGGAEEIFYGLQLLPWAELKEKGEGEQRQLVVVEGEMDALAVSEALRWARGQPKWAEWAQHIGVLSVPTGAPAQIKEGELPAPEDDRKFSYVYACRCRGCGGKGAG